MNPQPFSVQTQSPSYGTGVQGDLTIYSGLNSTMVHPKINSNMSRTEKPPLVTFTKDPSQQSIDMVKFPRVLHSLKADKSMAMMTTNSGRTEKP